MLTWNEFINTLNSLINKFSVLVYSIENIQSYNPYKRKLFEILNNVKNINGSLKPKCL